MRLEIQVRCWHNFVRIVITASSVTLNKLGTPISMAKRFTCKLKNEILDNAEKNSSCEKKVFTDTCARYPEEVAAQVSFPAIRGAIAK